MSKRYRTIPSHSTHEITIQKQWMESMPSRQGFLGYSVESMPLRQGFRWCRIQTMNGIYAFAARVPWNLCLRGKGSVRVGLNDSKQSWWMESMTSRQGFLGLSVESMNLCLCGKGSVDARWFKLWMDVTKLFTVQSCFKTDTFFFLFHAGSEMIKARG